jgi:Spy/CpxP family protein refolding chaperone
MRRAGSILGLLMATVAAVGCQGQKDESAPAAITSASSGARVQSASATTDAGPRAHGRFGRHAGLTSSLFRAANDLALPQAEQASLDAIDEGLRSDDGSVRAAMKGFRADLVQGVRSGRIDTAKLTGDDVAIDKALSEHQVKETAALDALHALLTPPQREALVGGIRQRQAERETRGAAWLDAKEADGGAADWSKRRLDRWTAELSLDPGQQKQVTALLGKRSGPPSSADLRGRWDDRRKRFDAVLTAFAAEAFDGGSFDLGVMPGKTAHEPFDHMVEFFSAFVPILHPDQRDKLATSLDRPFGVMGRPMTDGGGGPRGAADDIAFPFVEPTETPGEDPAGGR